MAANRAEGRGLFDEQLLTNCDQGCSELIQIVEAQPDDSRPDFDTEAKADTQTRFLKPPGKKAFCDITRR
ncbi:MAG TPA: hypothetical protein DCR97_02825 [Deltaproteobacteria bacterium]|nr:hypothetical protein [Deltaproteobacteria bacterium]